MPTAAWLMPVAVQNRITRSCAASGVVVFAIAIPVASSWRTPPSQPRPLEALPAISARSPACPVQRDAGDSAECARLRSSPDCQAEDALFAARSLQAQHLVLGAPLFAVASTT
jgi:hypothetical protein